MFSLAGKNALITGATGGIGMEIAKSFHHMGANIIASGTNEQKLAQLQELFNGERIITLKCDLSQPQEVEALYKRAEELSGGIEVLVCNAGITRDNLLLKMSSEEWDQVLNVNLKSVFILNQQAAKHMSRKRKGRIINISSVVALTGNLGQANYVAAKSGMIGFTKTVAIEVCRRNITANCIAPGFIESPMTDALNEQMRDQILERVPLSRMGTAQEIANCAVFLASDEAGYITGQVLSVNGGMHM